MVTDRWLKGKYFLLYILSITLAFSVGRLMNLREAKTPIQIIEPPESKGQPLPQGLPLIESNSKKEGNFVGSINSTKYHRPDCPGARGIKDENKIWFDSAEEAKAAGYTPAANCSGL